MADRLFPPSGLASYEDARASFEWRGPDRLNLGSACIDAQAPDGVGLIVEHEDGTTTTRTFGELAVRSNRLAGYLSSVGVTAGDRVGVVVPQSEMAGIAHIAIWKLGAISVPLATLFGPDALTYRLRDAGATAVITTPENAHKLEGLEQEMDIIVTGPALDATLTRFPPTRAVVDTHSEDPALLIYTSGTTGPPKGALHAHRTLIGHLPGFELYYEFAPKPHDVIWTPADWAWIGGLMDVLVPAWYHGIPVLTSEADFSPSGAVELMEKHKVTLAFLPPTALKMMRSADVGSEALELRSIFSGGEPLGAELLAWVTENLGTRVNEGYGQTECNLVVGNCQSVWPVRPGSMGRSLPGHVVEVHDDDGNRLVGTTGEICVQWPDPVTMLGYWENDAATAEKIRDGWLRTGDLGFEDADGYFWFVSRADDIITSMGYRIGPGEIEESLLSHPSVATCAVLGVPDELRGQVPAAFVVLRDAYTPSEDLVRELQDHVRTRLAAHEVPRTVKFLTELPRTTSGKVIRRSLRDLVS